MQSSCDILNQLHAARLLCKLRCVAEIVEARILSFLDHIPRIVVAGSLDGTACIFNVDRRRHTLLGDAIMLEHHTGSPIHSVIVVWIAGRYVVGTGCGAGFVRLFTADGHFLFDFRPYDTPIFSLQLDVCADGVVFAATATGRDVVIEESEHHDEAFAHVWRFPDMLKEPPIRAAALRAHRFGVNGLILDARSRLVATGSDDRTACIFDLDGELMVTCGPHGSFVWEVALAADLGLLATASEDHCARIFDLDGNCLARLQCGEGGCCEVAIDKDYRTLLTTSADGGVRFWSLDGEHRLLGTANGRHEVHCAASALCCGRFVSGSLTGVITEWEVKPSAELWALKPLTHRHQFSAAAVTLALG